MWFIWDLSLDHGTVSTVHYRRVDRDLQVPQDLQVPCAVRTFRTKRSSIFGLLGNCHDVAMMAMIPYWI